MPPFQTAAILGVGLIGGSLGMALRQRGLARKVLGIPRREETIREALEVGAIDEGTLDLAAVSRADLVILAPPVRAMMPLARAMAPHVQPGALVTDVGSTKLQVVREIPQWLPSHANFVGGHPMAGSEKGGVRAGRADLFEGAIYVLCREEGAPAAPLQRLASLVRALGATPIEMAADLHDDAVARISHLPHVVAAALAEAAGEGGPPADLLRMLVAGGFKSTTRIAASPPEMWRDVCLTNRAAILQALGDFETALGAFRRALESDSPEIIEAAFQRGKAARDLLVPPETPGP